MKQIFEEHINNSTSPLIVTKNPINIDGKTFIITKGTSLFKAIEFIKSNFKNDKKLRNVVLKNLSEPCCVFYENINHGNIVVNLKTSFINNFLENLFFIFVSKEFKKRNGYYTFLHEIAHTSKNQIGKEYYTEMEREFHSDFFALFFILADIKCSVKRECFLKGFLKFRMNNLVSPKDTYNKSYSKFIYDFFLKNMDKLNYKDNINRPQRVDDVIDNIIIDLKNGLKDIVEYKLLKYLEVKNEN